VKDKLYSVIAPIYPKLMNHVNYKLWADYYKDILKVKLTKNSNILELASGNCELSRYIRKYFPSIILTDISIEMLKISEKNNLKKVCCDMTALPFQCKFDAVISAFDSVNYLLTKKSLEKLFKGVYALLGDNGIFTFDVSLEKNSLKSERFLNRKGNYNNIKYIQRSKFDSEKRIHFNKFELTFPDGRVEKEIHRQRIYPVEIYFELLSNCGFIIQNCYDAFSFNDADEKSIRVQFVTIKGKRNA